MIWLNLENKVMGFFSFRNLWQLSFRDYFGKPKKGASFIDNLVFKIYTTGPVSQHLKKEILYIHKLYLKKIFTVVVTSRFRILLKSMEKQKWRESGMMWGLLLTEGDTEGPGAKLWGCSNFFCFGFCAGEPCGWFLAGNPFGCIFTGDSCGCLFAEELCGRKTNSFKSIFLN